VLLDMFQNVQIRSRGKQVCGTIVSVPAHPPAHAAHNGGNPATHFGRQMKKERVSRGWTLRDLSARTGINFSHLGRIENGHRPPTELVASACDRVFPERRGWFSEYYAELATWSEVPAGFKDWTELEDKSATLRVWSPGIVHGLLQTEDYARALLMTYPGVSAETVAARLAARMARQERLFGRDVLALFVVDVLSLCRLVGSAEVMAGQMRRLGEVAAMPNATLQMLPAVAHPTGSEIILSDDAAYAEHSAGGFVYGGETVTGLARLFDSLRAECQAASSTRALLGRMAEAWTTGGSQVFQALTAGPA
jgi:transcriptional regulator with XRE-family HTH domain